MNVSARLRNNQTSAFAQGTTTGDDYRIMALALQIDVGAPRFSSGDAKSVDRATAVIGDVLTYTVLIDNTTGTTNANDVVFFDTPPAGTSFVANSFTVNGLPRPGANPVTGVPLGTDCCRNDDHRPLSGARRLDSCGTESSFAQQSGALDVQLRELRGPAAAGRRQRDQHRRHRGAGGGPADHQELSQSPAIAGAPVTYQIVVRNDGPSTVPGAVVTDAGTTPALTGVSWTCAPVPASRPALRPAEPDRLSSTRLSRSAVARPPSP